MSPASKTTQDLEQNLLQFDDEKHPQPTAAARRPSRSIFSRMPSFRQVLCSLLLVSVLAVTLVSAFPNHRLPLRPSTEEQLKFQELLDTIDTIDTAHLHDILHKYLPDKYKHGVYPEDRKAIAAIHETNAAEASSLLELVKRQSSNNTTSEPPATSTSTVVQTTEVPTVSTVVQTTTPGSTQVPVTPTVAPTTEPTREPTTTAVTTEATTPVNTPTSQQVTTPTTAAPTSVAPTTAVETPTTPAESTSREAPGSTTSREQTTARTTSSGTTTRATTTRARSTSSRTSSVVFTTTFADGGVSTVTSVTVVAASTIAGDSGEENGAGATGTGTGTGSASLQTNGAQNIKAGMVFGIMGVVVAGVL